jgi:hypothetical protein
MTIKEDNEYRIWIKYEPCLICGYRAWGTMKKYISPWFRNSLESNDYEDIDCSNAPHHVGDGIHTKRYNDDLLVPVCDWSCDPKSNNCHHNVIEKNYKKWHKYLMRKALEYRRKYEEGV